MAEKPKQYSNKASATGQRVGYLSARSQRRLLVVDDEHLTREFIATIMTSEGYVVVTANDGLDALNKLEETLPHVIISDLNMPRMSGFEFLAVVRDKFPHLPVIAMSGEFDGNEVPPGVLADAYFPKAKYCHHQLLAKISELVSAPPRKPQTDTINNSAS